MKKIFWVICGLYFSACSHPNQEAIQEQGPATEIDSDKTIETASSSKIDWVEQQQIQQVHCGYDNETQSLGIGLVIAPATIELYHDSLLTNSYAKWDMYSSDDPPAPVCSKYYKPDYGIMHFVCLDKTERYFKVLIGYDQIKYLPAMDGYGFKTWQEYILESFGIRRSPEVAVGDSRSHAVRSTPSEKSEIINTPEGYELFCPMEINDDWVQVKYDCFYNMEDNPHEGEPCHLYIEKCSKTVTGWVKWRQDNRILIDILLMP